MYLICIQDFTCVLKEFCETLWFLMWSQISWFPLISVMISHDFPWFLDKHTRFPKVSYPSVLNWSVVATQRSLFSVIGLTMAIILPQSILKSNVCRYHMAQNFGGRNIWQNSLHLKLEDKITKALEMINKRRLSTGQLKS